MDEKSLILLAQNGDNEAKYQLFEMHKGFVSKLILKYHRRYPTKFDIEDARNSAFIGFTKGLKNFEITKSKFLTYVGFYIKEELYLLAKKSNLIISPLKESSKKITSINQENFDFEDVVQESSYNQDEIDLITKILDSLPERNANIVKMKLSGFSHQEISKQMKLAIFKVKEYESQAKRQIRNSLRQAGIVVSEAFLGYD